MERSPSRRPAPRRRESTRHETAAARAALFATCSHPARSLGLLLDYEPEYPFRLAAAALCGATVVGAPARAIARTDCAVLVTDRAHLPLLTGTPGVQVLIAGEP